MRKWLLLFLICLPFYLYPPRLISQERPVSFEYVFTDSRLNFAFDLGRAYQLGRIDAAGKASMMTRREREVFWGGQKGFFSIYIGSPMLLEELHKSYEAGYIDVISR